MPLPVNDLSLMWVCRMCERMATAVDLGGDQCGERECGSPLAGKLFPRYKGPFSAVILSYCFKCGSDQAVSVLSIEGSGKIGMCESCLKKMTE